MKRLLALLALCAAVAFAQVAITTARMDGAVSDAQGAVIVGADVTVINSNTGANFKTTTDEHGQWTLPSMPQATYRITVSMKGFRTTAIEGVVMNAGVPVTVNAKLEVGAVTETVEVSGAQELVQTTSATVNNTLEKRQMTELPTLSRSGLDLLMSLPGLQTGGVNRNSTINGLPSGAISITVDGLNTQDQTLKSSSGSSYFTYIPIQQDSVEEVTLSTAAAGADSTGEAAASVKFVTKSGTNDFHGGAFWQNRNTWFLANPYFNTINHQARNIVQLNQYGFHVGGPVYIPKVVNGRNKLFFFTNVEFRKLPNSAPYSRTVITQDALNGWYSWGTSAGVQQGRMNVLTLAAAKGFSTAVDPTILSTMNQILKLTNANCSSLVPRIASSGDFNTNTCNYGAHGMDRRHLSMSRTDYNLNSTNQISITYSYNMYNSVPDTLNNVVPIYPGTGAILGSGVSTGQTSNRFMGTLAVRSSITPHLTNAFQGGLNGGTIVFYSGTESPSLYSTWRGYVPSFGFGLSGVTTTTSPQRRNAPVKQFSDTLTWMKGSHMISGGMDFSQINFWQKAFGTETLPGITFGIATADPVHNGSTDAFTFGATGTMPGTTTQAQVDSAAALYALLTGRVSNISGRVVQDEASHQYGHTPQVNRDQQRQWGLFVQDSWRVVPNFTLNYGIRFEQQRPFENLSGIYTASTIQAAYGISGVGHLFQPGVTAGGMTPVSGGYAPPIAAFQQLSSVNVYNLPKNFDPSLGFAWQLPKASGFLGRLVGEQSGTSVLRAGFSVSTVREGINLLSSMYGSNPGLTYTTSISPSTYPQFFGAPGSVLFSQAALPSMGGVPTAPSYPMNTTATSSVNAFDPNLHIGYVESWNVGFQREFGHNNVIEVRYVGNHEVHGWRQVDLNEANLFESGFLTDFYNAYNNLLIARGGNINATNTNNFSNQGLPGQKPIPILQTALGSATTNNATYTGYLRQNRAGSLAGVIYNNATNMGALVAAGYPANLFVVNPSVVSGGSYLVTDWGKSFYNSGVIEYRRRFSSGLQLQANYVLSKSLANGSTGSSVEFSEPTTLRNLGLDKLPPGFDIRQAFKVNFIYELPFGHGKRFLSGNTALNKVFGGWQVSGIDRNQSGTPSQVTSGRTGMNTGANSVDTGVVLENMTTKQLQGMMSVYKTTGPASSSTWGGIGQVFYLPKDFIANSQSALEVNNLNWSNLNVSAPYVSPQLAPGMFGYRVYLYGPWQNHLDFNLNKRVTFAHEKANFMIQANCLNCLNLTNFFLGNTGPSSASFGQTTSAYTDLSNTYDPGGRIIEFVLRINF